MRYELADYVADCAGVSPWTIGKVFRTFHSDASRMDVLATAFLVQSENPGVPPAALWKRTIKAWLKVVKLSLGMTGRGGISADRRFAAVDADCDLSQVIAATYDAAKWQADDEQDRIAELVVTLLDALKQGFGTALRDGLTVEQAGERCGIQKSRSYEIIDRVRDMLAA